MYHIRQINVFFKKIAYIIKGDENMLEKPTEWIIPANSKLYNHELGNNLIGACADKSVVDVPELAKYMEEAIGVSRYEYVNSGVLLMNLKEI